MDVVLRQWFGPRLYPHYYDERRDAPPRRHRLRGRFPWSKPARTCVHGHFNRVRGTGVWDYYPEINQFVTVVRDPLEAMVSHYHYALRLGDDRYRAGRPIATAKEHLSEHLLKMHECYYLHYFPQSLSFHTWREHIEKHFVWIGVTEMLQESLDIMARRLGKDPVEVPVTNVTPRDQEATDEMRRMFRQAFPLEYEIYDFAVELNRSENTNQLPEPGRS